MLKCKNYKRNPRLLNLFVMGKKLNKTYSRVLKHLNDDE